MSAFQKRILNGGMITPDKAEQQKEDAMAEESLYYNQLDERWQSIYWGDDPRASFGLSGCGIFAFCNAVYALTGGLPDAAGMLWRMHGHQARGRAYDMSG